MNFTSDDFITRLIALETVAHLNSSSSRSLIKQRVTWKFESRFEPSHLNTALKEYLMEATRVKSYGLVFGIVQSIIQRSLSFRLSHS